MTERANRGTRHPDSEAGVPGGGRGRRDEAGGSGVYPASSGKAPPGAVKRTQAEWGQGDRGAEGYEDSGASGLFHYPVQLGAGDAAGPGEPSGPAATEPTMEPETPESSGLSDEEIASRRSMGWGGW